MSEEKKIGISNSDRAHVLVQAMPYIKKWAGETIVVKYGGNAMINPELKVLGVIATLYDARVSDDKDILALLKEEYNLVGVVKRLAVAKKGIYDGLAVVEQAPSSEIAKEYTAIAKMIINGNFDREDIENG